MGGCWEYYSRWTATRFNKYHYSLVAPRQKSWSQFCKAAVSSGGGWKEICSLRFDKFSSLRFRTSRPRNRFFLRVKWKKNHDTIHRKRDRSFAISRSRNAIKIFSRIRRERITLICKYLNSSSVFEINIFWRMVEWKNKYLIRMESKILFPYKLNLFRHSFFPLFFLFFFFSKI